MDKPHTVKNYAILTRSDCCLSSSDLLRATSTCSDAILSSNFGVTVREHNKRKVLANLLFFSGLRSQVILPHHYLLLETLLSFRKLCQRPIGTLLVSSKCLKFLSFVNRENTSTSFPGTSIFNHLGISTNTRRNQDLQLLVFF